MTALILKARLQASAWHVLASGLVAGLAALLVFGLWYPRPYQVMSGGTDLFLLIVGVDLVLGPLITLAIFDVRKRRAELWRDMVTVVLIQLGAMLYGLHTVFIARPVALALEGDRFRVSTAVQVQVDELPRAMPLFRELSMTGPVLVNTAEPAQGDEKFEAIVKGLAGADLGARPSYWRPWDEAARLRARQAGKPLAALARARPADRATLEAAAREAQRPVDQLLYLPVIARRADWSILIDKTSGDPVGFVPVDGF